MPIPTVDMDIHEYILHATCPSQCCMPISMLQSMSILFLCLGCMFMSVPHVQVHAARTWTCSMDLGMYNSMDTYMKLGGGHAVWTWTCSMDKNMLLVHVHVHAACPSSCCMSMSMLDVHVRTACPSICCMPMSLLHVMSLLLVHVHAA